MLTSAIAFPVMASALVFLVVFSTLTAFFTAFVAPTILVIQFAPLDVVVM